MIPYSSRIKCRNCSKIKKQLSKKSRNTTLCIKIICSQKPHRKKLKRNRTRSNKRRRRSNRIPLPNVRRYFYTLSEQLILTQSQQILAQLFVDDHGNHIKFFPVFRQRGYYNLYINGVMQKGGLYNVNRDAIYIKKTGQTIPAHTPIIIECVNFRLKRTPK